MVLIPRAPHRSSRSSRGPRARGRGGFSVVEVLLAAALFLVVTVFVLPLFTRAISNNLYGQEATQMSNHARTEVENLTQLTFNNWEVDILAGDETVTQVFYVLGAADHMGDESWEDSVPSGELASWGRTTTVRQYQITGVEDTDGDGFLDVISGIEDADQDGELDNPLPAGAPPSTIHLRELVVQLDNQRSLGALGAASDLTVRTFKAF